ncbi:hypothetical protein [Salmonella phage SETP13]|uniref:Uncharacterized protein n=1 Tax=Salmonella phage SETP13 TaxID=424949 RepID=U5N0W2_9CAUD|nr:hypothetical protein V186_gp22 [Salmonella phage SETP13]AGX84626.1 hypothetical protein [Salmonella phage SETP13]
MPMLIVAALVTIAFAIGLILLFIIMDASVFVNVYKGITGLTAVECRILYVGCVAVSAAVLLGEDLDL